MSKLDYSLEDMYNSSNVRGVGTLFDTCSNVGHLYQNFVLSFYPKFKSQTLSLPHTTQVLQYKGLFETSFRICVKFTSLVGLLNGENVNSKKFFFGAGQTAVGTVD